MGGCGGCSAAAGAAVFISADAADLRHADTVLTITSATTAPARRLLHPSIISALPSSGPEGMERAPRGSDPLSFLEDPRAHGGGELSGVAIDFDERDPLQVVNVTSGCPARARFMNVVQMGSAACVPLVSGWLSSSRPRRPRAVPAVKPTNQASRRSLVVPDLPAASCTNPLARGGLRAFVDDAAHHVGDEEGRVGEAIVRAFSLTIWRSCPPLTIRESARSGESCRHGENRVGVCHLQRHRLEHAQRNRRVGAWLDMLTPTRRQIAATCS